MELTGHSYESFMNMPYRFFEHYFKWKTEMVKEQNNRQKEELKKQQDIQRKLKADQRMALNKNRIKNEYVHPNSATNKKR